MDIIEQIKAIDHEQLDAWTETMPLTTIPEESDARLLVQAAEEAERRAEEAKRLAALQAEKRRAAARRAGHEERCVQVFVDYVEKAKIWQEGVQLLNRFGCSDEAIRMACKGVQALVEEGELKEIALLMEPLADAFSGKGDFVRAAAIRAEQFLEWRGCYAYHMTTDRFYAVLADAEKAGLRTEVRAALVHALETGWNPPSIVSFRLDEMKPGGAFQNPPRRIDYFIRTTQPEAPAWPLPWASEGVRLEDTRWDDFVGGCYDDFVFLLQLALAEGNKEEIARRFCDLPAFPGGNENLLERVKDALRGFRPDIVEVIVLQGRGWKNIWTGKCAPKTLRDLCK